MNIFEIFSLNKHGDYQEVLFSSTLSYLLNPNYDHGLNNQFLSHFLKSIDPALDCSNDSQLLVKEEEYLGSGIGNIDIAIQSESSLIGIEVKIWDRSAVNVSKEGKEQLLRYAESLEETSKNKEWRLIFIVPHCGAGKCAEEYKKIVDKYPCNAIVIPFMKLRDGDEDRFAKLVGKKKITVAEILLSFIDGYDFFSSKTQSLMYDLYSYLSNNTENRLYKKNPDPQKFPSQCELQTECPEYYKLLVPFTTHFKRYPNPMHTTVGFPHGIDINDVKIPNSRNALFRIRTTKAYYESIEEKEKHLPIPPLEIELWQDVYEKCEEEILSWVEKHEDISGPENSYHLDKTGKEPVKIVKIAKVLNEEDIKDLIGRIVKGFKNLYK